MTCRPDRCRLETLVKLSCRTRSVPGCDADATEQGKSCAWPPTAVTEAVSSSQEVLQVEQVVGVLELAMGCRLKDEYCAAFGEGRNDLPSQETAVSKSNAGWTTGVPRKNEFGDLVCRRRSNHHSRAQPGLSKNPTSHAPAVASARRPRWRPAQASDPQAGVRGCAAGAPAGCRRCPRPACPSDSAGVNGLSAVR